MLSLVRVVALISFLGMLVGVLLLVNRGKKGKVPTLRRLPPLDAVEESVGRATEMGRPVHFTTGYGGGGLTSEYAPYHMAGLAVLEYVAHLTARNKVRLLGNFCFPELVPMAEDTIRTVYMQEGALEAVNSEMYQFVGGEQFAYAMGVMGSILTEKPAASILVGNFWAESLIIAEPGTMVGALQIGGGADVTAVPMLVAACDYVLMFGELFVASAYITKDPILTASITCEDFFKIAAVVLGFIGVIFAMVGIDWSWIFAV